MAGNRVNPVFSGRDVCSVAGMNLGIPNMDMSFPKVPEFGWPTTAEQQSRAWSRQGTGYLHAQVTHGIAVAGKRITNDHGFGTIAIRRGGDC